MLWNAKREQMIPFQSRPLFRREAKHFDRVVSPECVSISINNKNLNRVLRYTEESGCSLLAYPSKTHFRMSRSRWYIIYSFHSENPTIFWLLMHIPNEPYVSGEDTNRIYPKHPGTITPLILILSFNHTHFTTGWCAVKLLMNAKHCRPWSDAVCGVWSGSTVFTEARLSEYFG